MDEQWNLFFLPLTVAMAIVDKAIDLVLRFWDEMTTWPERTRNYWRFDNPDHLSPSTIAKREADRRWFRYAASDEGKRRLNGE